MKIGLVLVPTPDWWRERPVVTSINAGRKVLNLCDVLQECNPAVQQDLPILHLLLLLLLLLLLIALDTHTHTHTKYNVILCSKLYFVLLKL